MTSIELKCRRIHEVLRTRSEFVEDLSTGEFCNLGGFGITFRLDPPFFGVESDTLRSLHFCDDRTWFLPNEYLWWKELPHGEYERIVNTLYSKLHLQTSK